MPTALNPSFRDGLNTILSREEAAQRLRPPEPVEERIPEGLRTTTPQEGTSLTETNISRMYDEMVQATISSPPPLRPFTATEVVMINSAGRQIVETAERAMEGGPAGQISELKEDKEWEKMYHSRTALPKKVAHILLNSKNRIEELVIKIDVKEAEKREMRRAKRETIRRAAVYQKEIEELKKKKKALEKETPEQQKDRLSKAVENVMSLPQIENVEVDKTKRIFITTKNVVVNKDYWDKPRNAGRYQIMVDFYKPNFLDGVKILNITQRFLEYDHPCIKDTSPCWGNMKDDMRKDFEERDIYELVVDSLLYLSSPNDDYGWIEYSKREPGDQHKKGWEQFFDQAKKMPKHFNFKKYEKEKEIGNQTVSITQAGHEYWENANQLVVAPIPELPREEREFRIVGRERDEVINRLKDYLSRLIEFRDQGGLESAAITGYEQLESHNILAIQSMGVREHGYGIDIAINGIILDGVFRESIYITNRGRVQRNAPVFRFRLPNVFRNGYQLNYIAATNGTRMALGADLGAPTPSLSYTTRFSSTADIEIPTSQGGQNSTGGAT